MSGIRSTMGVLVTAACVATLAACGGDEGDGAIPRQAGEDLIAQLDLVEASVESGDCDRAHDAALEFASGVSALPQSVGGDLRSALVEAAGNLAELSQEQCESGPTGPTGELEEPATTEPTTTTTEETTTTDEEPPDSPGGNQGNQGNQGKQGSGQGPPQTPPGQDGGEEPPDDDSSGGIGSDG